MSIELPLYAQEKDNTCALACLRMVLAAYGTRVAESSLEAQVHVEEDGTLIDDLERLANSVGLVAEIQETQIGDLRRILADGAFAIAYIDRSIFDLRRPQRSRYPMRNAKIHTVIPTRITKDYVRYHDPRTPKVTVRTIDLFKQAHSRLAFLSVVCSNPQ